MSNSLPIEDIFELIEDMQAKLERLRGLVQAHAKVEALELDPKDPRNKFPDGKLTPRGVEVCYALFDAGRTRYAVAEAMAISYGAATHRLDAWKKAGGSERQKLSLD